MVTWCDPRSFPEAFKRILKVKAGIFNLPKHIIFFQVCMQSKSTAAGKKVVVKLTLSDEFTIENGKRKGDGKTV